MSALPGVFSAQRLVTLGASIVVAASSGTNYAYSAYAPQLGARLHITHTQLNIIALAGNVGVYSTGPLWGRIVDARGPKVLLASAFVLLLGGYYGIKHIYDAEIGSTFGLCMLAICSWMTGAGGNGGLTSGVNASAKSFPDHTRATATGLVLSGFGLSAFLFSTISRVMFPGDTSSFLLVLALGTSIPQLFGFIFVRPIPLPARDGHQEEGYATGADGIGRAGVEAAPSLRREDSNTPLLTDDEEEQSVYEASSPVFVHPPEDMAVELSPTRSRHSRSRSNARREDHRHVLPNIYGKQLFKTPDFWILFVILSLLSGTGLMWINNVGSVSQALLAKAGGLDDGSTSRWQAEQVSAISLANFSGRIVLGIVADFLKHHYATPRVYCVSLVAFFFILSQISAASVTDVTQLWKTSGMLGFAYGGVFAIYPAVCIELFGLAHFSENWGFMSVSPMLGGNLFSLAFGRNLDAHAPVPEAISLGPSSEHQCLEGRECYVDSITVTLVACTFAMGLSVWAAWRERARLRLAAGKGTEVVWDAGEN